MHIHRDNDLEVKIPDLEVKIVDLEVNITSVLCTCSKARNQRSGSQAPDPSMFQRGAPSQGMVATLTQK